MSTEDRAEVVEALTGLVSRPAAELYAALLDDPDRVLGEPGAEVEELVAAGLASMRYGGEGVFIHPPRVALGRAVERAARRWLDMVPDFDGIADALATVESRAPSPPPATGVVEDPEQRQQVAESLVVGATRQVRVLQPYYEGDYQGQGAIEELSADDSWTTIPDVNSPRDVLFRMIYDDRLLRVPGFEDVVRHELDLGAQVRITNQRIPTFLMIIDDDTAAFTPRPDGPGEVTDAPGLVGLLEHAFESFWTRAVPLDRGDELSPTLRTVLAMVGLGQTNRQIAHTLGVHERTVRRRVEDLLDHFGDPDRTALVRRAATLAGPSAGP